MWCQVQGCTSLWSAQGNVTCICIVTGLMNRDFEIIRSKAVSEINHYAGTGSAMSIAANRVSFTFNLTGPSLTIDTACSSFLFALHCALRAIKSGNGTEEIYMANKLGLMLYEIAEKYIHIFPGFVSHNF